jgi:outer membrane protein OmpA-like peptidoglycan-associated protein
MIFGRATLLISAVLAFAELVHPAFSSPADGPYIRLEGGATLPANMPASGTAGLKFNFVPENGPIAGGAVGLRMTPFRLELGVDWMSTNAGKGQFSNDAGLGIAAGTTSLSGKTVPLGGTIQNIPVMGNFYVDFPNRTPFEPYLGFGVGFTAFSFKNVTTGGTRLINSSQRVFAYQPIVGVNVTITDQVTAGVQYRYFKSIDPSVTDVAGHRFTIENAAHNVLASLTYHFFAPAPPPTVAQPAPAPQPAPAVAAPPLPPPPASREYLVFFDFDSSKLTAAGQRTADGAIAAYQQNRASPIIVRGFTDLVGSDSYNLVLSKKRAMTVAAYMSAHGVKQTDMSVDWEGKANPRVQTTAAEPQNRRVEIHM